MRVYPVALAVAWDLWDKDPAANAPKPRPQTKAAKKETHTDRLLGKRRKKNGARHADTDLDEEDDTGPSRNYFDHYQNCLRFCAGIRIMIAQSISPAEGQRGQNFFSQAFQSWAAMNCHLTPNFHRSMHLLEYILTYGPVYGWWVFCYERFIGTLGKFNTNGHGGGEIEGTLMRGWWKLIRCQELVCA